MGFSEAFDNFSLFPKNATQFVNHRVTGDSTYDESELASSDLNLLRDLASKKIADGTQKSGIGYKDYGVKEDEILKDGYVSAAYKSWTDPKFRMATLLGNSNISIEDGKVYVTDTYDFNKGPKRIKYKKLMDSGNTEGAQEFLDSMSGVERQSVLSFADQDNKPQIGGARVYLGTLDELKGDKNVV
jgi:hypothetical protein